MLDLSLFTREALTFTGGEESEGQVVVQLGTGAFTINYQGIQQVRLAEGDLIELAEIVDDGS